MLCDKCGYSNNNNIHKCVSCGAVLSSIKMSEEEITHIIDELADKYPMDPLEPTKFEKIFKWICFMLSITLFVGCLILTHKLLYSFISAALGVWGGVTAGYPKVIWELEKLRISLHADADNMTPTDLWSMGRKISYWGIAAGGIGFFIAALVGSV